MSDKYSKEDAYQTIALINSWINNVDAKTSFALAYVTALMGFAFANDIPSVFTEFKDASVWTFNLGLKLAIVSALYITSIGAILNLFMVIFARVKNDSGKKSMMFFGTIAEMNLNEYKAKTMNMDDKDITKDLLEQVHTNSRICTQKINRYNKGIKCLIVATVICFIIVAFGMV